MVVIVDSGHGLRCPNGSPDKKLLEYEWADIVAARLVQVLTMRGIYCTYLNPEIEDTPLRERVRRVNAMCETYGRSNCLLISLHLNADGSGKWTEACGFSVFVSKKASRRSKVFAELITREAEQRGMMGNRSVPAPDEKGCRYSTWFWRDDDIYILTRSNCPAVLTESGFMTNPQDYEMLMSEEGRERIVAMHADAVQKYIDMYGKRK